MEHAWANETVAAALRAGSYLLQLLFWPCKCRKEVGRLWDLLVLLLKKSLLFSAELWSSYSFSTSSFREKAMLKSPRAEGGRAKSNCRAGDAVTAPAL